MSHNVHLTRKIKIIEILQITRDLRGLTTKNRENGAKMKPTGEGDT